MLFLGILNTLRLPDLVGCPWITRVVGIHTRSFRFDTLFLDFLLLSLTPFAFVTPCRSLADVKPLRYRRGLDLGSSGLIGSSGPSGLPADMKP